MRDVVIELHSRRARTVLMLIAVALSTGSLIAAFGLSSTASKQVDSDLAAAMLNRVSVTANKGNPTESHVFTADAPQRAEHLGGVAAAGLWLDLTGTIPSNVTRLSSKPATEINIVGATSGYLAAQDIDQKAAWMLDQKYPVAFVGSQAATQLSLPTANVPVGYTIDVDGRTYSVLAVIDEPKELSSTVVMPYAIATSMTGSDRDTVLLARTQPGAGAMVSMVIRTALRPDAPQLLQASQVIDAGDLRTGVSIQLDRLIGAVGGLLLALTILLIANAMVVSVAARTKEIGLRRAIGASRPEIAALFFLEGAIVGLLGGLAGGTIGCWAVVAFSAANNWSALISPLWPLLAAALGLTAGVLSALYPAVRASTIAPATAVRAD